MCRGTQHCLPDPSVKAFWMAYISSGRMLLPSCWVLYPSHGYLHPLCSPLSFHSGCYIHTVVIYILPSPLCSPPSLHPGCYSQTMLIYILLPSLCPPPSLHPAEDASLNCHPNGLGLAGVSKGRWRGLTMCQSLASCYGFGELHFEVLLAALVAVVLPTGAPKPGAEPQGSLSPQGRRGCGYCSSSLSCSTSTCSVVADRSQEWLWLSTSSLGEEIKKDREE